jgi:hypothetical protein
MVGRPYFSPHIPFFGKIAKFQLQTGDGKIQNYTSVIRPFGWSVCFGVTRQEKVVTLCQWKHGVNRASLEFSPGGIGEIDSETTLEKITERTELGFLRETGYGNGNFRYLGYVEIETGMYRGVDFESHGYPAHLFLATELEYIPNAQSLGPNDIIETLLVPLAEFPEILASGILTETSAVACAYKALEELGILKWQ